MSPVLHEETKEYFYKKVIRLGLPIALSQLFTSLLAFIDTIMVSSLGDNAVAAVGIGASVSFLMFMVNFGLISGLSIYFAQFWGTKDIKSIHKTFIISAISALIIASFFFIAGHFFSNTVVSFYNNSDDLVNKEIIQSFGVDYIRIASFSYFFISIGFVITMLMRSVEKVIFPQVVSILMVLLNTGLNYLLINGKFGFPNMGIEGAATATLISSAFASLIMISYMVFTKREVFRIRISVIKDINIKFVKQLLGKALPVALNETFWGLGMTMYLISFSFISVTALPSYHIANQIMGMFWVVNAGISSACAIMLGNKLGEGNIELAKDWGRRFVRLAMIFGVVLGIALYFSSSFIPGLFGEVSSEVKASVTTILIVFSFYVPIKFTNAIHIIGTLRSGGDTVFAFIAEVGLLWGVGVPLAYFLSRYSSLDFYLIVIIVNLEEVIKFIFVNARFLTYKWAKNLTLETV